MKILTKYNKKSLCDCDQCKGMCKRVPCIGTPRDIMNIIEKKGIGFVRENFSLTTYAPLKILGFASDFTRMIAPNQRDDGSCVFFNENGLCDIHEIKPTEGLYTSCHDNPINPMMDPSVLTAMEWTMDGETMMEVVHKFTGSSVMASSICYNNKSIRFKFNNKEFCVLDNLG